ncbi:unnamed protein product [Ixodes persulcatus]
MQKWGAMLHSLLSHKNVDEGTLSRLWFCKFCTRCSLEDFDKSRDLNLAGHWPIDVMEVKHSAHWHNFRAQLLGAHLNCACCIMGRHRPIHQFSSLLNVRGN